MTVALNSNGFASYFPGIVVDKVSDNCSVSPLPVGVFNVNCDHVGSVRPITIRVLDNSGNQSSCVGRVTIVDDRAPQALCQDATIQLDELGVGSITAAAIDNGSNDACGLANLSLNTSSFDCDDLGENTVELTVTDPSGNSSSCSATVTVEDNIAPQALCQHVTIQLDETGNGSLTAAAIDNGSSDACGLANMSLDISSFDCSHLGDNTVHLSVTDLNGNTGSCKARVKVVDVIAPVLQCKDVTVSIDQNGFASFRSNIVIEDMSDNCGLEPRPYPIYDLMCTAVGTAVPINLTERDFSGNQSSCAATVTIVDDSSPQAVCQDVTVQLDESGLGAIAARDIDNGSNDNCDIADLSLDRSGFACSDLRDNAIELTVTDPSGNSSSCSATVTVEDNVAPIVSSDLFFLGCGEDEDTDLYEVDRMASDNCTVESERSYIAVLGMTDPSIRFRKKNKWKLKFNLADNKITVEAPGNGGAEAWWQEITAEGGVPVDVGQALKLTQPEDPDEWVYKFASSGALIEVLGNSISLISTASDVSGNQASSAYTATLQCGSVETIIQAPSGSSLSMPILDKQELNPMNTTGSMEVFPNPFSIRTTIQYAIADRAEVAINIYDMNGRQISRLFQGEQDAGQHSLEWDGSTSTGGQLPAGIYLVQLKFGSEVINKRIVLQP